MLLGCSDAEIQRIWDTVYLKAKYIECENAKIPGCMMHINISLQIDADNVLRRFERIKLRYFESL